MRRLRPVLAGLAVAGLVATAAVAAVEEDGPASGATAARLASTGSNRYDYWAVAAGAFADQPLRGTGAGGFAVAWRRERTVAEGARDAHSLYVETAAELGLVGVLLLAAAFGGVVASARHVPAPALAGPAAALAAWALHAGLDWDWELPALTLVAVLLAGALMAAAEPAG